MGNTKTTVSSDCHNIGEFSDQQARVSLGFDPTRGIKYDSSQSYAVCVGIGQQDKLDKGHLGPAADNDALQVQRALVEKYSFLEEQTLLLNSSTKVPTQSNIKEALSSSARNVGQGGLLLFHFSGHCSKFPGTDQAVLIPSDYDKSRDTVITSENLTDCLRGTRASAIVILLDCCHSGQIAKQLVYEWNLPGLPTHILVSCTSEQNSLSFRELGNGIFTYFLVRYLRIYDGRGQEIPTGMAMEHCKPLCEAVTRIMNPAYDGQAEMRPGIWVTEDELQYKDEVDHSAQGFTQIESKYRFLNRYLQFYDSRIQPIVIPACVDEWLNKEAKEPLYTLKEEIKEMAATIFVLLSQSIAKLLYEHAVKNDDLNELFQGALYLSAVQHVLQLIDVVEPNYSVSLCDLEISLMQYIVKLKVLTNVSLNDSCMDDLIRLTNMVSNDIRTQKRTEILVEQSEMGESVPGFSVKSPVANSDEGQDTVDGLPIDETYARLNVLLDERRSPVIPDII